MTYVIGHGGLQHEVDESVFADNIKSQQNGNARMLNPTITGFEKGIVKLSELSLKELNQICERDGLKITVQLDM